jgi:hypothetical protein
MHISGIRQRRAFVDFHVASSSQLAYMHALVHKATSMLTMINEFSPFWHCMICHTLCAFALRQKYEAPEIQGVKLLSNMSTYHRDDFRSIMFTHCDVCVFVRT